MKPFTLIAAAIFLLMALLHLYRIAAGVPITIGGTGIGQEVSWAGLVVTSVLAAGLFRDALRKPAHDIMLVAESISSSQIVVSGKPYLPRKTGGHVFRFTLDDRTGKNVEFDSLTSEDESSTCPPDPNNPGDQIEKVEVHNGDNPRWAQFVSKNNHAKPNAEPMDVSYQWTFRSRGATVDPYDPIISNGGRV